MCYWFDITEGPHKKEKRCQRLGWGIREPCNHGGETDQNAPGNRKQYVSTQYIVEIVQNPISITSHFDFVFYLLSFSSSSSFSVFVRVCFSFLSLVSSSVCSGGSIRLYTEKLKSQPIIATMEENPLPIQYISFAGFESSEVQFFYNCSHIDTSVKSVMGWFNAKIFKRTKFVIVWQKNKKFYIHNFSTMDLTAHVVVFLLLFFLCVCASLLIWLTLWLRRKLPYDGFYPFGTLFFIYVVGRYRSSRQWSAHVPLEFLTLKLKNK